MKSQSLALDRGPAWRLLASFLLVGALLLTVMNGHRVWAAPDEQLTPTTDALEWMGIVETRPADGNVGAWKIGGRTFLVDANTVVDDAERPLTVGVCAEVDYETTADGDLATELSASDSVDCTPGNDDDGGDGNDKCDELEDSDLYDTTPITDTNGISDTDVISDTDMIDEESSDEECDEPDEHAGNELYGTIDGMPSGTLTGTWIIDGVSHIATDATEFEEEQGEFAVGVSVEFEFAVVDGLNQLAELETHRAPGMGSTTRSGIVQQIDPALIAASANANNIWQIGDVAYRVLPVTELNEEVGALVIGALAEVNSYTATDGTEVATRVRAMDTNVTMNSFVYLPAVLR